MVASKRERVIGLLTAGVLAVLALDRLLMTPLTERGRAVAAALETEQAQLQRAEALFDNRVRLNRKWNSMVAAGIKSNIPDAERQALEGLRDWAQDAGVTLTSLKPERVEAGQHFRVVVLRATCGGSLRSISEFLWRVQTTEIPMRVTDVQISARRPGTDDLSVQLGVSTLCLAPPGEAAPAPRGGRPGTSVASAAGGNASVGREAVR